MFPGDPVGEKEKERGLSRLPRPCRERSSGEVTVDTGFLHGSGTEREARRGGQVVRVPGTSPQSLQTNVRPEIPC